MGEEFILWVQQMQNGFWDSFLGFCTNLGAESFYLIIIPLVYWCLNKRSGLRLALICSVSGILNSGLKELFSSPRPDPARVRVLMAETGPGYGFPSGHTQGSTTFWFTLAKEFSKRWLIVVSCVVVFLVGFSRIYLGVHWLGDVLGGLAFGLIIVFGGMAVLDRLEKPFLSLSLPIQFALAILIPVVLLLFHREESTLSMVGNLIGFGIGAIIEREWIGFTEKEDLPKQMLKLVLGLGVLFAIKEGFKLILPAGDIFRVLRYGLIGFVGAAGIPYLFTKVRLSQQSKFEIKA